MGLFTWLRKKPKPLYPEALWTVACGTDGVQATDQTGKTVFVSGTELSSIAIETNDSGPWGADVWWLLFGRDGKLACAFPQGATGEKEVIDYLMALPAFDNDELVKAMGSTGNAVFPVWRRAS
jgi:hypothetical protein